MDCNDILRQIKQLPKVTMKGSLLWGCLLLGELHLYWDSGRVVVCYYFSLTMLLQVPKMILKGQHSGRQGKKNPKRFSFYKTMQVKKQRPGPMAQGSGLGH